MDEKEIWNLAKEELAQTVPTFKMWIEPLEAVSFDGNMLSLITAHALAPQAIKSQHNTKILTALKNVCGKDVSYNIVFDEEFADKYQKEKKKELKKQKSTPVETEETKLLDMTSEEYELLTIDTSNVKTNKTGQYVVSYYYNASVVDKENKIHNYKLTGFIVVNVK